MPTALKSYFDTILLSLEGCYLVLKQWRYLLIALLSGAVIAGLLYTIVNWSSTWPLLSSPLLPFLDRLALLVDLPRLAVINHGLPMLLVAIVQGAAISLLIYNSRTGKKVDTKSMNGSILASAVASHGLGCSVCGTSLLLPIIGLFGASGMYAAADTLAMYINLIALTVGLIALLRLGYISYANYQSQAYLQSKSNN